MSLERVAQLEKWVERMDLSQEQRTLALEYVSDLRELVKAEPGSLQTRHAVSHATMMLGLWARPVPMGRDGVQKLLDEHKLECAAQMGSVVAGTPAAKGATAAAVARAAGIPAAWITTVIALQQSGVLKALGRLFGGE